VQVVRLRKVRVIMKKTEKIIYCKCTDKNRDKIILKGINTCMVCWRQIEEPVNK
jgi:hypothetical protein